MDRVDAELPFVGPVKGLRIAVAAFVLSILLFGVVVVGAIYVVEVHSADANRLREGLVESCERNGNPLRKTVQDILRDQIKQSESPLLARFFPQIPKADLDRLIAAQNELRRERIQQIAPVDCQALYTP